MTYYLESVSGRLQRNGKVRDKGIKKSWNKENSRTLSLKIPLDKSLKKHIKIFRGLAETFRFPYKPSFHGDYIKIGVHSSQAAAIETRILPCAYEYTLYRIPVLPQKELSNISLQQKWTP